MTDYQWGLSPYDHQLREFDRSKDKEEWAFFMDRGTGKSATLIATAGYLFDQEKIDSVLVICFPSTLINTWTQDQVPEHLPQNLFTVSDTVSWKSSYNARFEKKSLHSLFPKQLENPGTGLRFLVVNVEALASPRVLKILQRFVNNTKCLLAIDESTSIKNSRAKRTKAILKLGRKARYRRILTGLPDPNSPLDLYPQMAFLNPDILGFSSYTAFKCRYAIIVQRTLKDGHSFPDIIGFQNQEEIREKIAAYCSIVKKEDCLDLPPKIFKKLYVDLTPKQARIYRELRTQAIAELEQESTVTALMIVTRRMRLHQITQGFIKTDDGNLIEIEEPAKSPKIKALLDILAPLGPHEKVIIWGTYNREIEMVVRGLQENYENKEIAASYYGPTPLDERQRLVEEFQEKDSPLRFLVIQPKTGARGLTLTQAQIVVFMSNSEDLELRVQAEDRCHRIGQLGEFVMYYDIFANETKDKERFELLRKKDAASILKHIRAGNYAALL